MSDVEIKSVLMTEALSASLLGTLEKAAKAEQMEARVAALEETVKRLDLLLGMKLSSGRKEKP